jgi:5-methylcytosine-specific restriction endonuclease McrA
LRIFVLDKNHKPLMPCHPARARKLLAKGRAAVFRQAPFTIILKEREGGTCQDLSLQLDPGSKITGVALVAHFKKCHHVMFAAHLKHRGQTIKKALDQRKAIRRGRRFRKTRYRSPRFDNRTRPTGWLPPSLKSRIDNIYYLAKKLCYLAPVTEICVETVRFDTQKLENPEISGTTYQQGTLFGYEVREYLLEKWKRECAYCGTVGVRLEIDHIVPKALGGTNRVSNLAICCRNCNEKKNNRTIQDFLNHPQKVDQILTFSKRTLKDAAAVNTSRKAVGVALAPLEKPLSFWSGGQTKYNRTKYGLQKEHWIDAVCVGNSERILTIPEKMPVLEITATGRGSRQQCLVTRFGFPRSSGKQKKRVLGFQTGDLVHAVVPSGKKKGRYHGRVAIRATGNFNIKTDSGVVEGIQAKYCRLSQRTDGYSYIHLKQEQRFLPAINDGVSALSIR